MNRNYNGVKYYSATDLSCGHNAEKAEVIIKAFLPDKKCNNINKVIELFNIKLLFDNNVRLAKWQDNEYENYKDIVRKFQKTIGVFFDGINEMNFIEYLEEVEFIYIDDFWFLIDHFKTFKRIPDEVISRACLKTDSYI